MRLARTPQGVGFPAQCTMVCEVRPRSQNISDGFENFTSVEKSGFIENITFIYSPVRKKGAKILCKIRKSAVAL